MVEKKFTMSMTFSIIYIDFQRGSTSHLKPFEIFLDSCSFKKKPKPDILKKKQLKHYTGLQKFCHPEKSVILP